MYKKKLHVTLTRQKTTTRELELKAFKNIQACGFITTANWATDICS